MFILVFVYLMKTCFIHQNEDIWAYTCLFTAKTMFLHKIPCVYFFTINIDTNPKLI